MRSYIDDKDIETINKRIEEYEAYLSFLLSALNNPNDTISFDTAKREIPKLSHEIVGMKFVMSFFKETK